MFKTTFDIEPDDDIEPAELTRSLARRRKIDAARRADQLDRVRAEAAHGRARADVAQVSRLEELNRAEAEAEVLALAELARMYRQARAAGERTRIRSVLARSGEARALRLERLRSLNLRILAPLLIGFGVWSTAGVQAGAARLMGVTRHDPVWWVLWGLEALLIGVVCWIIVVRARLATAGGRLSRSAGQIGAAVLTVSIVLNMVAALPSEAATIIDWWAVPGSMFAHVIGPVGAAIVAHLIGVIDASITAANPWHDTHDAPVPRLAEMDLHLPEPARVAIHGEAARTFSAASMGEMYEPDELSSTGAKTSRTDAPRTGSRRSSRTGSRTGATARPAMTRTTTTNTSRPEVDKAAILAELTQEALAAIRAGEDWTPDYEDLMARTGRRRSWAEKLGTAARRQAAALALGTDASARTDSQVRTRMAPHTADPRWGENGARMAAPETRTEQAQPPYRPG